MAVSSRLAQYEKRQALKSAVIYIVLTVAILFLLTKFGPSIVTSITGVIAPQTSDLPNTKTGLIAPPQLTNLPPITKEKILPINGTAQAGMTVRLTLNGNKEDTLANAQGNWNTNFTLNEGANSIKVQAVDSYGNTSAETTASVSLDTKVPTLSIAKPEDNTKITSRKDQIIDISGNTDPEASVKVNDRIAVVDANGQFSLRYSLSEGDNTLTIISTDPAGNITQEERHVSFTP